MMVTTVQVCMCRVDPGFDKGMHHDQGSEQL